MINPIIEINSSSTNSLINDICKNINTLFSTVAGTVVFDREYGIDNTIFDLPVNMMKSRLTVEYINKVKKYEPRASVKEVIFNYNEKEGIVYPKVVIELGN